MYIVDQFSYYFLIFDRISPLSFGVHLDKVEPIEKYSPNRQLIPEQNICDVNWNRIESRSLVIHKALGLYRLKCEISTMKPTGQGEIVICFTLRSGDKFVGISRVSANMYRIKSR